MMDQIAKALALINGFKIEGLEGAANPSSGAKLDFAGALGSLALTAEDGQAPGIVISSQGFGIKGLSLPTSSDPSLAVDPYLSHLRIDLQKELFARLAVFAKEKILADMHQVVNRVQLRRLNTVVRLTSQKVAHVDVELDLLHLQQDNEELIRIKNIDISLLDYPTKLPPREAQKACKVVIRSLQVEIEQAFFEKVLDAVRAKIPKEVTDVSIELPGPNMVVGAHVKKSIFRSNVRADLQLETDADLFGILIKRLYVPGTNVKVPSIFRDWLLGAIRFFGEKKLKGLAEVSNESIRINPWPKVPVEVVTKVTEFAVREGKIVISFGEPEERRVPLKADDHLRAQEREPLPGDHSDVLAPGPCL